MFSSADDVLIISVSSYSIGVFSDFSYPVTDVGLYRTSLRADAGMYTSCAYNHVHTIAAIAIAQKELSDQNDCMETVRSAIVASQRSRSLR